MFTDRRTIAQLEAELVEVEVEVAYLRSRQLVLVNELDKAQAPLSDASRSMVDWVQCHLDVKRDTARDLVFAARRFTRHRGLHRRMINSGATFDRTVAAVKLADSGATAADVDGSYRRDLGGVARMISDAKRVTPVDESQVFSDRYFTIQPNLDESRYRMWGEAPGIVGRTIEKAICERADQLKELAPGVPSSRGQRQLDALTAMAHDSLDGTTTGEPSTGHVTVFVDATGTESTEPAGTIEYGPNVGPQALEQMLCTARVQIVCLDSGGVPVRTSRATRAIPRAVRHMVAHRDGGCVIDGCNSTYRLQPHHITRYTDGGNHHPDNLVTLCWYHHHVAIHGTGYRIDPTSPPLRRRLIRGHPPRAGPP